MLTDSQRVALQTRQQQLVKNLIDQHTPTADGLLVYRNSLLMNAARALNLTYPVMTQLIGEQAMVVLARELLLHYPPLSGDWAEWGGDLADLIQQTQALSEMDFLQDIVELEWTIHQVNRLALKPIEFSSLQHLEQCPLEQVRIHLSSSIFQLSSNYPIDDIWRAHRQLAQNSSLDHRSLAEAIAAHQGERHLLIYQQNSIASIRQLSSLENSWLSSIQRGLSVAQLMELHPEMDFVQWFSQAVTHRWITHLSNDLTLSPLPL